MKFDYLILGASGAQGKIVARDLLEKGNKVLLADIIKNGSVKLLEKFPRARFRFVDLRKFKKTYELIKKSRANVVINCAESDWNFKVHKACLIAGVHVVDLDSDIPTTKKQLELDRSFKNKNLTAITGCGSTPGINNIMLQYASQQFDKITTIKAGFAWNSNLKKFVFPFSIHSIIWELTQPASVLENGRFATKAPFGNVIEKNFREIGKQKAFLVEHSEVYTFHHYFKEKGLKNIYFYASFPDHSLEILNTIIELGLASREKIPVDIGLKVAPADLVNETLRSINWPAGYLEKENLWVEITGEKYGEEKMMLMECLVPTLEGWESAGCNIDTGFPASIIAQMIKDGRITDRGSFAPEAIVPCEEFFRELWERKMIVYQDGTVINGVLDEEDVSDKPRQRKTQQLEAFVLTKNA